MVDIPTTEPATLRAGDTWQWRREDLTADYPASDSWTLSYRFVRRGDADDAAGSSDKFDVAATADGAAFAVTVAATTTAGYRAGIYEWIARVSKAGVVTTVATGVLELARNIGAIGAGEDLRSHAQKVLDAIERVIEGRATKGDESYTIAGRSLTRTPFEDLRAAREYYRAEVAREQRKADLAAGRNTKRFVRARFDA